jgi:P-type conjugative transfer protein TrbJ
MANAIVLNDEQHQRLEVKLRREFGDLILKFLADDRTEDILLNPDSSLWVKRMGEGFSCVGEMSPAGAASALGTVAAWRGTVLNHERPILETELPIDGSRFEGIVPPVVRRPVFAIRLRPKRIFTLEEYEAAQILTKKDDPLNRLRRRDDFSSSIRGLNHAETIRAAVRARKNLLVVGSTGSGKTTLVNAVLDALAQLTPNDRVISIEDTTELQCSVKNYLDLRAVGAVTMLECLRACMRLCVGIQGPEPARGGAFATEITQLLNQAQLIMSYLRQGQQLVNELNMYSDMLRNAKNIPNQRFGPIQADLNSLAQIVQGGRALAYSLGNLDQQFRMTFPGYRTTPMAYYLNYKSWSQTSLDTTLGTLRAAGLQGQQLQSEQAIVNSLQGMSQTADGRMQALNVMGQIAEQQVQQMMKLRELMLADMSSKQAYQAATIQQQSANEAATEWFFSTGTVSNSGVTYWPGR